MSLHGEGPDLLAKHEIRSLLWGISAVFVVLLASGVALGLKFRADGALAPNAEAPNTQPQTPAAPPPTVASANADLERPTPPPVAPPLSESRTAAIAARAPTPPQIGVRVGIFGVVANAERMQRRLIEAGHAPLVVLVNDDGRPLRYVYAGAFDTEVAAAELARALTDRGMAVHIEPIVGDASQYR